MSLCFYSWSWTYLSRCPSICCKNFKNVWFNFLEGVQLSQGYRVTTRKVYFLPLSSQKFLVLNWWNSEGWKAELTLQPPSGFEPKTLNWESKALLTRPLIHVFIVHKCQLSCFLTNHFCGEFCLIAFWTRKYNPWKILITHQKLQYSLI